MRTSINQTLRLRGEDGDELTVHHNNRGDPYREGIQIDLSEDYRSIVSVFLETREAKALRDLLNQLYPKDAR